MRHSFESIFFSKNKLDKITVDELTFASFEKKKYLILEI